MKSWPQQTKKNFDFLILAGGKFPPVSFVRKMRSFCKSVIVLDRGLKLAQLSHLNWDIYVGDGDSSSIPAEQNKKLIIPLPKNKNLSDLEWALKHFLKKKNSSALVLAAHRDHEGRLDHAMINWLLLFEYHSRVIMADENSWMVTLKNQKFKFQTPQAAPFTLMSRKTSHLEIKGALYSDKTLRLSPGSRGLSNETRAQKAVRLNIRGEALLFVSSPLK